MAKEKNMNELKKELEMDEHRIPLEVLIRRLDSDLQNVSLPKFVYFPAISMWPTPDKQVLNK